MTPSRCPPPDIISFLLAVGVVLLHSGAVASSPPGGAPRTQDLYEALFDDPAIAALSVAPDGDRVAYVAHREGERQIIIAPLTAPRRGRSVARAAGRPVALHWLPGPSLLAIEDDADGQRWRVIEFGSAPDPKTVLRHLRAHGLGPRFLGLDEVGRILLSLDRTRPWVPDVYRIDPGAGVLAPVESNPGDVFSWIADPHGALKLARRWRAEGESLRYEILFRPRTGLPWRVLAAHRLDQPEVQPLGFSPDGGRFYLAREIGAGRQRIERLDATTGQPDGWTLSVAGGSVAGLRHERVAGALALVDLEAERPGRHLVYPAWAQSLAALARLAPEARLRLAGSGKGGSLWRVDGDREPGAYYLAHGGAARRVLSVYPALDGFAGAPMRPVSFDSRDGQRVHGYWTPGGEGRRALVLLVHGGPWRRDRWGWNAEAQWLARLGYHVLQVNFRGSRGVSHRWLVQGRRQWGLQMQDDLEDAVRWAVTAGIADPTRVCAMGGSYGGYAALMLLASESRPLRCAVARAPVTDLGAQILALRRQGNRRGYREWVQMVGDPRADAVRLTAQSPLHQADRLRGAVLLAHGTRDRTVDFSQSEALVAALRTRNAKVVWLPLEGQGHQYMDRPRRRAYYRAVAAFLGRQFADN